MIKTHVIDINLHSCTAEECVIFFGKDLGSVAIRFGSKSGGTSRRGRRTLRTCLNESRVALRITTRLLSFLP